MFSLFDTNNDGRISPEEFGKVFKRLGYILNDEELQALVREIDYNSKSFVARSFVNRFCKFSRRGNSTYYVIGTCHFARKIGTHNSVNSGGF